MRSVDSGSTFAEQRHCSRDFTAELLIFNLITLLILAKTSFCLHIQACEGWICWSHPTAKQTRGRVAILVHWSLDLIKVWKVAKIWLWRSAGHGTKAGHILAFHEIPMFVHQQNNDMRFLCCRKWRSSRVKSFSRSTTLNYMEATYWLSSQIFLLSGGHAWQTPICRMLVSCRS